MTTTKWVIDAAHSEVNFKVKHLMISTVTGQFNKFDGYFEANGDDFTTAKAHLTIDLDSISTNNAQRDAHLKTNDFFDMANHPQLTFASGKITKVDEENYKVEGTLTMRGITKKIDLAIEYGGIIKDPWGNTRVGFSLSGKINRKDWGVSFGMVTDTGGLGLGEEVKINASVQFVKEAALQPA